ncbi:MAG: FlxA-like family protein [Candidatus Methanoperedens sp.]|nr:FlxA-like family protein [Candidatus Methanoperedens sp.]
MKSDFRVILVLYLVLSLAVTGCIDPKVIYEGTISGSNGGEISVNGLAMSFPESINEEDIQISITRETVLPEIAGTTEQIEAYNGFKVISPIYKITSSQSNFDKPFYLKMTFDPSFFNELKDGEGIFLGSVSEDGKFEIARVVDSDFMNGYITVETNHFSTWFMYVAPIMLITIFVGSGLFIKKGDAWNSPWQFVEPGNQLIKKFISDNNIKLPDKRDPKGFVMQGYTKKFVERKDLKAYISPYTGSQVLNANEVSCWDLTNFFGSILYTLASDPQNTGVDGEKIRLVSGTANVTLHGWIEIVIDNQIYVVDTSDVTSFKFVAKDDLYKKLNLKPAYTWTKDIGSLSKYDNQSPWYLQYITSADIEAQIKALTLQHKKLQEQLEDLNQGTITDDTLRKMDEIRRQQKEIYNKVMELKKKSQ